jgi:hypothetical protein
MKVLWWGLDFVTDILNVPFLAIAYPYYMYLWIVDMFGPGKGFQDGKFDRSWFIWRSVDVLLFGIPDVGRYFVRG